MSVMLCHFMELLHFPARLKFRVATVPTSRYPDEFKVNGLRNLPAIIHGSNTIDTVEEIVDYIDEKFPTFDVFGNVGIDVDVDVDKLTRNFFSRQVVNKLQPLPLYSSSAMALLSFRGARNSNCPIYIFPWLSIAD